KTELATKRFVAWYMGRNPYDSVAVATYSDTMAEDYGGDVRAIMASPQFKQVFPGFKLRRGSTSKSNLEAAEGGRAVLGGAGGALTGRGAHCFPAGTMISTTAGDIPIEHLPMYATSVNVLSYNRHTGQIVEKGIQAFAARKATRLYRVTTASGRVVTATGD